MNPLKVNIKDFYPNANYSPYLMRGQEVPKPLNSTLEVGMLMYDEANNSIGMILGCIDEAFDGEVRLDSDGMQPIANLRFATDEDFLIHGIKTQKGLEPK